MKKAILIMLCVLTIMPSLGFAGSPWTEKTTYGDKLKGKLDFGLRNLLGGWTELITRPKEAYDKKENFLYGVGRGLYNSIMFTVGGAVHVITFPIPIDVPLPGNGVQLEDNTGVK